MQVVCSRSCSRQAQLGPLEDRFLAKVEKTDTCWLWLGNINAKGYGVFKINKRYVGAHRFAYATFVGAIPTGMEIAHTCDIRRCVNPEHLWVATHAEHVRDMNAKGRRATTFGVDNPNYRHGRYVTP